ncbi:hypothetical protein EV183_000019 [Coemansia sp. RSA 2336]|nr:hypothetical protein EV183_000641 [Coemansia sp. RSA 2336]KAJ2456463.1 hypothetical protein EV183_000019 [Coemansia sp. RSA 2336]
MSCANIPPKSVRHHTSLETMGTLQCDTPVYDDFVRRFLADYAVKGSKPAVKLARKFCHTWPVPKRDPEAQPPRTTVRVGVMDSSFNPPHYCHGAYMECLAIMELMPAAVARGQQTGPEARVLGIDAFLLLLGSDNADKPLKEASLEQRMRMVDMLATTVVEDTTADTWHLWKSRDQFDASNLHNMAIGMVNTPRFVDKCQAVRAVVQSEWKAHMGEEAESLPAPRVLSYFAMGWDTLIRVFDPKYYSEFPAELDSFFDNGGRIAYSRRVGFPNEEVDEFFARPEMAPYLQYIFELKLPKRVKHISSSNVRLAVRDSTESVRDVPPRILEYVNNLQLYRSIQ